MPAARRDPPALHDRAIQDLSFIRRTMEGAASFTDVPGWGLVSAGGVGLVAAFVANRQPTPERWLAVWIAAAVVAVVVGGVSMYGKMRRRVAVNGAQLLNVPARRFLLSFWPAILAGAAITIALVDPLAPGVDSDAVSRLLPGVWLLLYGVGVTTAGAFSVRAVPLMGIGFIALGTITLFVPPLDGDVMMALGFGALQIVSGVFIARRHGG